jgi:glycerol-3-phosphate acyltransferase PlsX
MNKSLILAIDAMGGENAPLSVIEGLAFFCEHNSDTYFHIFGNQNRISTLLDSYPSLKDRYTLFHTEEMVLDDESPIRALKNFPNSSMRVFHRAILAL